jgi:serine/threonine protein kinase
LNSARLGIYDYDYDSLKIIKEGGQGVVFEITSKIDGKSYAAKRLEYRIGSRFPDKKIAAAAEREVSCLRVLKHPMIVGMLDLVKDQEN